KAFQNLSGAFIKRTAAGRKQILTQTQVHVCLACGGILKAAEKLTDARPAAGDLTLMLVQVLVQFLVEPAHLPVQQFAATDSQVIVEPVQQFRGRPRLMAPPKKRTLAQ